jgi:hypothetical protein
MAMTSRSVRPFEEPRNRHSRSILLPHLSITDGDIFRGYSTWLVFRRLYVEDWDQR